MMFYNDKKEQLIPLGLLSYTRCITSIIFKILKLPNICICVSIYPSIIYLYICICQNLFIPLHNAGSCCGCLKTEDTHRGALSPMQVLSHATSYRASPAKGVTLNPCVVTKNGRKNCDSLTKHISECT